jgi:dihydrofolate reductase
LTLSYIVAASENNAIGSHNELPWHLPADFKYFKKTTLGKPILMGRKTYESLGKPLPGRINIVVSAQEDLRLPEGVIHSLTLQDGIETLKVQPGEEGFIIGGGQIFAAAMGVVDRIYMTRVHTTIEHADAFFPIIDHSHWKLVWEEEHAADEQNNYPFTFQRFEQVNL